MLASRRRHQDRLGARGPALQACRLAHDAVAEIDLRAAVGRRAANEGRVAIIRLRDRHLAGLRKLRRLVGDFRRVIAAARHIAAIGGRAWSAARSVLPASSACEPAGVSTDVAGLAASAAAVPACGADAGFAASICKGAAASAAGAVAALTGMALTGAAGGALSSTVRRHGLRLFVRLRCRNRCDGLRNHRRRELRCCRRIDRLQLRQRLRIDRGRRDRRQPVAFVRPVDGRIFDLARIDLARLPAVKRLVDLPRIGVERARIEIDVLKFERRGNNSSDRTREVERRTLDRAERRCDQMFAAPARGHAADDAR